MISWMQKHKKYLIITIWVSTIAFIGAGFVGWGQYKYGDKASAVAKVGEIKIQASQLQKAYSNLYAQYNQMFQGNFDEEKAKALGLQKQALKQLIDQALILNLAKEYDLVVTDDELLQMIQKQDYFFKNGTFDKDIYKQVLSRNNWTIQQYEDSMRRNLLIEKTLKLLPVKTNKDEEEIISTFMGIADKIQYKILNESDVNVDTSDEALKAYWETKKQNFMTEKKYDIQYIKLPEKKYQHSEDKIIQYYNDNKFKFKDSSGKILSLDKAKSQVIQKLDEKSQKKDALKTYIAYKKGKITDIQPKNATICASDNPFGEKAFDKISHLNTTSPFAKPILINKNYYIFKLVKVTPSVPKTFKEAKKDVLPLYLSEQKGKKLIELAKKSVNTFKGKTTPFITNTSTNAITELQPKEALDFLVKLFTSSHKKGYITLNNKKVVLYNILEQKLLQRENNEFVSIISAKKALFNEGLIKKLQSKYDIKIFIKGL